MPAWKTVLICIGALTCLALALFTVVVTLTYEGGERWMWMGGLLVATASAVTVLILFMNSATAVMDAKRRRGAA